MARNSRVMTSLSPTSAAVGNSRRSDPRERNCFRVGAASQIDRGNLKFLPDQAGRRNSIHFPSQLHVHKRQAGHRLAGQLDRLLSGSNNAGYPVIGFGQESPDHAGNDWIVLDNEDLRLRHSYWSIGTSAWIAISPQGIVPRGAGSRQFPTCPVEPLETYGDVEESAGDVQPRPAIISCCHHEMDSLDRNQRQF